MVDRIVLATRNRGKVAEIKVLLEDLNIEILTVDDFPEAPEVEEDAPTLEGNARKKAQALFDVTGLPSLADDTGLEVDALDGAPGVMSARFSGPEADPVKNRALMLQKLSGIENRSARFRTVVVFHESPDAIRVFEGKCEGVITTEEKGEKGFGYDPIFMPDGCERTFAELEADEKNAISHRGQAVRAAAAWLHEQSGNRK